MQNHLKHVALCAITLSLAAGCTHTGKAALPTPEEKPAAQAPAPAAPPAAAPTFNKGTVTEVIAAGRYSYINVDSGSAKTWFAVPFAELKVGQQVEVRPGMEVKNYNAKSLNRTFDSIYFSDGLTFTTPGMDAKEPAPTGHGSVGKLGAGKIAVQGKVVEIVEGSEFDFLAIEGAQGKRWVALPSSLTGKIVVGQELKLLPGDEIKGFKSGAVNRTFDRIIFSGGIDEK